MSFRGGAVQSAANATRTCLLSAAWAGQAAAAGPGALPQPAGEQLPGRLHPLSTVWAGQAAAAGPGAPPQPAGEQLPGRQRAAAAPGLLLLRVPRPRPLRRGALSCTTSTQV